LLIIDVFLFYRLTILFGERKTHEYDSGDIPEEIGERKKAFLLLLWLIALVLPLIALISFRGQNTSYF
jgi:hypothetical protein